MTLQVTAINGMGSATDSLSGTVVTTGMNDDDIMALANDLISSGIVGRNTEESFKVTQNPTPNKTTNTAKGVAYITNPDYSWADNTNTRLYRVTSDSTEIVTHPDTVSNPRVDLVAIKIDKSVTPNDDASNVASIAVITGSEAASPSAPSVPSDGNAYEVIAHVTVTNPLTTITTSHITDKRIELLPISYSTAQGWVKSTDTPTYTSYDPTYSTGVVAVSPTATDRYQVGWKVRMTQPTDGVKYGIITAIGTSSLTIWFGTDYNLDNEVISNFNVSPAKMPYGFPTSPNSWAVVVTDNNNASQSTPTASQWYNLGTISLRAPIGRWRVNYNVIKQITAAASTGSLLHFSTLSTANNSESDTSMTSMIGGQFDTQSSNFQYVSFTRTNTLNVASGTQYFFNARTGGTTYTTISHRGDLAITSIRFESAYI